MRIALRPSGGRGDYELAGSDNGIHVSDLLDKRFFFQLAPGLTIDGKSQARRLSGKPRIRPEEEGQHAYAIIYAILLLPPPRRELDRTSNDELSRLISQQYILYGIDVEVVQSDTSRVVFAPTNLWAKNKAGVLKIDFAERMALVSTLWSAAAHNRTKLGALLQSHRDAVLNSEHKKISKISKEILDIYHQDTDVLPLILDEFNLTDYAEAEYAGVSDDISGFESEDNDIPHSDLLRDRIVKWRKQVVRGPDARRFSTEVREAYNSRCLFSGERFPKLEKFGSPGVDAAHILPWSSYQLNTIENGLCLCKLCHWGFDSGLIKLDFDESSNDYILTIPLSIEQSAKKFGFDLHHFQKFTGLVKKSNLPTNKALWPSPALIRQLNANS